MSSTELAAGLVLESNLYLLFYQAPLIVFYRFTGSLNLSFGGSGIGFTGVRPAPLVSDIDRSVCFGE